MPKTEPPTKPADADALSALESANASLAQCDQVIALRAAALVEATSRG